MWSCRCSLSRLGSANRSTVLGIAQMLLLVLSLSFTGCQLEQSAESKEALKVLSQARSEIDKVVEPIGRNQPLVAIARLQGKAGRPDLAEKNLEQVVRYSRTVSDPSTRLLLLRLVAEAESELGNIESAKQTFREILKVVSELEPYTRCTTSTRYEIAVLQARMGLSEDALQTIQEIDNPSMRLFGLYELAQTYTESGRYDAFRQVAQTIESLHRETYGDSPPEVDLRLLNALALAQTGQHQSAKPIFEELLREARLQNDPTQRAWSLIAIAEHQIKAGDTEQAVQTLDQALRTVQGLGVGLRSSRGRDNQMGRIARAYAQAGRHNEAIRILKEIRNPDHTVVEAGRILAEAGRYEDVLKIADQFATNSTTRTNLLQTVGIAYAKEGQIDSALQIVDKMGRYRSEVNPVLAEVAIAYVRASQFEQAVEVLNMASERLHGYESLQVAKPLAKALAQSGQTQKALELVEPYREPRQRAEILISIAEGLLGVGEA